MNMVSKDAVKLLNLKIEPHPNPFRVTWVNDHVISTLKLSGWPTNLVFSQLKEYPISLNCYKDIYP